VLDSQFEELRLTGRLPSPTGVGLKILEVTQRDDVSLQDVVQILLTDPTLTGRLIQFANTGEMSGRAQVTNAQGAAMRLGLQTVRSIALGFSLLSGNRTGRCKAFDYDGFWEHSLAVAAAAQIVARLRGDVVPADAFTCGLLQGLGRLALASIHPDAYEGVLERARGLTSAELARIEEDCFGTHHRELAAAMLRDWRLPESFCEAVAHVGSGAQPEDLPNLGSAVLARTLQDARDLARVMTADIDATSRTCRQLLADLQRMQSRLGYDDRSFSELWQKVVAAWAEWGDVMGIRARGVLDPAAVARRASSTGEGAGVAASVAPPAAEAQPTAGLRILLAGPRVARDAELQPALAAAGHATLAAVDVRSALSAFLEHAPHVVLFDLDPAGEDALKLARMLRQSEAGQRVHLAVIAERRLEPRLLEAFEAGADEYFLRPLDVRLVLARLGSTQRAVDLDGRVRELLAERETRIGELAIATRKLKLAAVTDPLTGLYNRRFACERLSRAAEIARGSGRPLSVIAIDLDRFKSVNDEHGHDVGDEVLRAAARTLAGLLRKGDALCRMGGEEFLAICPGADLGQAAEIGERLRAGLASNVIRWGTFERAVTGSLGAAQYDPTEASIDALLKTADRRVYLAKEGGRNRVVAADPPEILRAAG
jgi:diguanylate cyclase (GGDEF)-like protein